MVKILGLATFAVTAAVLTAPAALADPADTAAPADPGTSVQAAPAAVAAPPAEVPHLTSPQNLPPGTTDTPDQQSRGLGYLRDLLHAIRTQDVKPSDALLLLAQRPMSTNTAPGVSAAAEPAPAPAADPAPAPATP